MAATANPGVFVQAQATAKSPSPSIPWYIWIGVAAVTSSSIGGLWDVSWHRSIGRDTFWTPAHMMIYLCGVLVGIVGMFLVIKCTFGDRSTAPNAQLRAASVSALGLRAPLGVFLAGWGGLAMLTSAPFDNWWHNAYGLDVKIVSPPHALLMLGIRGVEFGMVFLILAAMNRAAAAAPEPGAPGLDFETWVSAGPSPLFHHLQILFLYIGGLAINGQMFFLQEYTWDVMLHQASAYIAMSIFLPIVFAMFSAASRFNWAATATAAVYTLFGIAGMLILPLFPAQAKLGPVFYPVTHFVPAKFPILIVVPALALDLLWQRARAWKPWQIALASGVVFVAVVAIVEWPFANFLMSKASQNRFFGTGYFQYNSRATGPDRMRIFFHPDAGATLYFGLLRATLYASISTWLGLLFGRWMRGVQR
jgi:hypothetical protein